MAILELWGCSAGVAMETEILLRQTSTHWACSLKGDAARDFPVAKAGSCLPGRNLDHLFFLRFILNSGFFTLFPGHWPLRMSHQLLLLEQDPLFHGLGQQIMLSVTQHWEQGDIWRNSDEESDIPLRAVSCETL